MRPSPRRPTGQPEPRHDEQAKRPGAWTTTRRGAATLVLVSWLAVLGCETARPSSPATSPTSTPSDALPLAGTVWVADEIDGQRVVDGVASTIMFDGQAQAVGSTGCNRYVAPLHVAGSTLRLGDIAMTRRACPPAVMDQERRFVVALGAIRTYHQEGDTLWLLDETGHVLVRLVRTQASASVRVNSDKDRRALREPGGRPRARSSRQPSQTAHETGREGQLDRRWRLPPCRPLPDVPEEGRGQPRPTNGIFVAMMVRKSTFASSGRLAM
jgi:heat shock protein HslJ